MKKGIYILLFLLLPFLSMAQETKDTVNTKGGSMSYFYSMDNGKVTGTTSADWHIAFEISGFSGSVRINGAAGVKLYRTSYSVADFAKVDTNGMKAWEELLNSRTTWSSGAFNTDPVDDFDLGWGVYNPQTHIVSGDSVYLMKLPDDSYKKIYINRLEGGKYYFTHASIDGSNEKTSELIKSDFAGKVFGYFNFTTDKTLNPEPAKKDWDILFTKYVDLVYRGPQPSPYPVSGILVNQGVEVAQREGMAVSSNDTSSLTWEKDISTIGSDWKTFKLSENKYEITDDLTYFLRLANGAVWKVYFTNYLGGQDGEFQFTKELIKASASSKEVSINELITVYPNPSSTGIYQIQFDGIKAADFNIQVTDMQGRVLINSNAAEMQSIDLSSETDGLYFINLLGKNSRASKAVLKN